MHYCNISFSLTRHKIGKINCFIVNGLKGLKISPTCIIIKYSDSLIKWWMCWTSNLFIPFWNSNGGTDITGVINIRRDLKRIFHCEICFANNTSRAPQGFALVCVWKTCNTKSNNNKNKLPTCNTWTVDRLETDKVVANSFNLTTKYWTVHRDEDDRRK